MISEPAARSLQVMAWPRTGARGGGSSSSSVLGQALLKSSLKSPFFQEFGNVVCGVCTPLSPPGIIKNKKRCTSSEFWKQLSTAAGMWIHFIFESGFGSFSQGNCYRF